MSIGCKLQVLFFPQDWALSLWRWPVGETRDQAWKVWSRFGFWHLSIGPVAFRWWPAPDSPTRPSASGDQE